VNAESRTSRARSFFRANQASPPWPSRVESRPDRKVAHVPAIIEVRGRRRTTRAAVERKLAIPVRRRTAPLRREHTELRPIEGRDVTAPGDIIGLSVTGTIGEHQINQPQFAVDLDDDEREPLPGMRQALTGIPIDTKDKPLEIEVPEDHKDETIRGRRRR
jgi:hypothetical protein